MHQIFSNSPLMERKRRHRVSTHRWTDEEAYYLVREVSKDVEKRAAAFEKPTAEKFYSNIAARNKHLRHIPWTVMKAKMRYVRNTYTTVKLKSTSLDDNSSLAKKCPNYELLDIIFGRNQNVDMSYAESSTDVDIYAGFTDSKDVDDHEEFANYPVESEVEGLPVAKKQRIRLGEAHWWSKEETATFIRYILEGIDNDPRKFEKPSARLFYETHCKKGILESIEWRLMRNKMRYFRILFMKAEKWLEDVGTELFKSDGKHVTTRLNTICPYYTELKPIFESRLPMDPIKVSWHAKLPAKTNNAENTQSLFKIENGAEPEAAEDSFMNSDGASVIQEETHRADTEEEEEYEEDNGDENSAAHILNAENENYRKAALELQREKFEFEKHKFAIECEQRKQQDELQRQLLELEKEKLDFEKLKLHGQDELKKYEIDQNIALKKLELEKNERLQKIELRYKYKDSHSSEELITEELEAHEELI